MEAWEQSSLWSTLPEIATSHHEAGPQFPRKMVERLAEEAQHNECISGAHVRRFPYLAANWLALLAAAWAAHGKRCRRARLFAAATTILPVSNGALGSFADLLEECLSIGRSQVDELTWKAAWEEGQSMTLQEAVAYALDEGAWDL